MKMSNKESRLLIYRKEYYLSLNLVETWISTLKLFKMK